MEKKRYNVGLVVGNVEDDFSNRICKGAIDAAVETDANLFVVPMKYIGLDKVDSEDPKLRYEYQYNYLANYVVNSNLDLVLLSLSNVATRLGKEEIDKFLNRFDTQNVYLIAAKAEGRPSVIYDNRTDVAAGVRYMREVNGCEHICMLKGQEANIDSNERFDAYKKTLNKLGFTVEDRMHIHADLGGRVSDEVEKLIADNPEMDGLVCANDMMALTAMDILRKHGLIPGKDVYVLGFDDVESTQFSNPPLASIQADPYVLGYNALKEGLKITAVGGSQQGATQNIVVDTKLIIRESLSGSKPEGKNRYEKTHMDLHDTIVNMINMDHKMNIVNRDMLVYETGEDRSYDRMLSALQITGISNCLIYTMRSPMHTPPSEIENVPEYLHLRAYMHGEKTTDRDASVVRIPVGEVFTNEFVNDGERHTYTIVDLFSGEYQYGIALVDLEYKNYHYLENISYSLCIAMKMRELFLNKEVLLAEKEMFLDKLEKENLRLDEISSKDSLTGILNRRGIMNRSDKLFADPEFQGKEALLVYGDLDYLKQINDNFTHGEGNYALISCAQALDDIKGSSGYAGRMGGDEFAAICLVDEVGEADVIYDTIKKNLAELNKVSGKPYEVNISLGIAKFVIDKDLVIQDIFHEADIILSKDKEKKKPFVMR